MTGRGYQLKQRRTFVVGEGSQIPMNAKTAAVERTLRFIVTLGRGPKGPDVFVSAADPHPSGSLLMKELKLPWQNWHSPEANIPETAFARDDPRRRHECRDRAREQAAGRLPADGGPVEPDLLPSAAARC